MRVLIQYSVITFRATSMAHTDIDAINKNTYNFYLVIEVPDHVYIFYAYRLYFADKDVQGGTGGMCQTSGGCSLC